MQSPVAGLFPVLATPRTVPCHAHLDAGDLEVPSDSNIFLQSSERVLEFDYLTAAETYQVVMLSVRLGLVVVMTFIEVQFLYQAQFF
jgi:hypothetical protein